MRGRVFLCLFSLLFLLVACKGDSVSQNSNSNTESKEEILLWHYYTGSEEVLTDLKEKFNDSHDEVVLKTEYVPFSDIKKQLSIGSAGDSLPDIIISDTVDNASLASMGVLTDITDRIEEWGEAKHFLESPLNSTVYQDKNYGLPLTSNALGLFYNKKLLEEAGISEPPATWQELEKAASKLTNEETEGMGISAVKSEEATFQFYPFLYSAGGNYKNLEDSEAQKALDFVDTLFDEGYMSQDILNATQDDLATKFGAEELAMMVNGPWMIERLKEANPEMDFGIAPIPRDEEFSSVLGGDNIALIKEGNVDASWEFVTWLMEPEQLEGFAADTGYFPPRQDILNDSDYWKSDEHLSEFIPIMEFVEARGPSANWPKVSEAIQVAIQEVLTDSKTSEEALEEASQKIREITE